MIYILFDVIVNFAETLLNQRAYVWIGNFFTIFVIRREIALLIFSKEKMHSTLMLSFRIEERGSYKNCCSTSLRRSVAFGLFLMQVLRTPAAAHRRRQLYILKISQIRQARLACMVPLFSEAVPMQFSIPWHFILLILFLLPITRSTPGSLQIPKDSSSGLVTCAPIYWKYAVKNCVQTNGNQNLKTYQTYIRDVTLSVHD
jgi:hypothetical protein